MKKKYLIVHADDFGLSPGISRGILHTMRAGIVSSASVMVRSPYLHDTKQLIQAHPARDWGLHVWTENPNIGERGIINETIKQLLVFKNIFKCTPTHIDFHRGFRFTSRVYFAVRMFMMANKFAFRYDNAHAIDTEFYGYKNRKNTPDDISVQALLKRIDSLKEGVTELVCHPGWTNLHLKDPYRIQRNKEVIALTSPSVTEALQKRGVVTITYKAYGRLLNIRINENQI